MSIRRTLHLTVFENRTSSLRSKKKIILGSPRKSRVAGSHQWNTECQMFEGVSKHLKIYLFGSLYIRRIGEWQIHYQHFALLVVVGTIVCQPPIFPIMSAIRSWTIINIAFNIKTIRYPSPPLKNISSPRHD